METRPLDNVQSLAYFSPELVMIGAILLLIVWDLVSSARTKTTGLVVISLAALAYSAGTSPIRTGLTLGGRPRLRLMGGAISWTVTGATLRGLPLRRGGTGGSGAGARTGAGRIGTIAPVTGSGSTHSVGIGMRPVMAAEYSHHQPDQERGSTSPNI